MKSRLLPWVFAASLAAIALHAMRSSVLDVPFAPAVSASAPSGLLPASFAN